MKTLLTILLFIMPYMAFSQATSKIGYKTDAKIEMVNDAKLMLRGDTIYEFRSDTSGNDTLTGKYYLPTIEYLHAYVKANSVIDTTATTYYDSVTFNPNIPIQKPFDYKMFADSSTRLLAYFKRGQQNPDYVNVPQFVPFYNNTGDTLKTLTPISATSISYVPPNPLVSVVKTHKDSLKLAQLFIGLVDGDVPPGKIGLAARFDFITKVNTSAYSLLDRLYVDTGILTNIQPEAPAYPLFVGTVFHVDNDSGVVGVNIQNFTDTDTEVNLQGSINGMVTKKPGLFDTVIGGNLYVEIYNEEDSLTNLPFMIAGERYNLNTTSNSGTNGFARVQLAYGADSLPLKQYVYIDNWETTPQLAVTTGDYPSGKPRVCAYEVRSNSTHNIHSFAYVRRENNAVNGSDADGLLKRLSERVRLLGSYIRSGVEPNISIITNPTGKDSLIVTTNVGIGYQLNKQIINSINPPYVWLNSPKGDSLIWDLSEINLDANGNTLESNNTRYGLNGFVMINSSTYECYLAFTSPRGIYSVDQNCIDDVNKYAVTSVRDGLFDIAVRLLRIPLRFSTSSGGTLINLLGDGGYQNEKNFPLGVTGSGSATTGASKNVYTDGEFKIVNILDPTKVVTFDASIINTSTERNYVFPDKDGTMALLSDTSKPGGLVGDIQLNDGSGFGSTDSILSGSIFKYDGNDLAIEEPSQGNYIYVFLNDTNPNIDAFSQTFTGNYFGINIDTANAEIFGTSNGLSYYFSPANSFRETAGYTAGTRLVQDGSPAVRSLELMMDKNNHTEGTRVRLDTAGVYKLIQDNIITYESTPDSHYFYKALKVIDKLISNSISIFLDTTYHSEIVTDAVTLNGDRRFAWPTGGGSSTSQQIIDSIDILIDSVKWRNEINPDTVDAGDTSYVRVYDSSGYYYKLSPLIIGSGGVSNDSVFNSQVTFNNKVTFNSGICHYWDSLGTAATIVVDFSSDKHQYLELKQNTTINIAQTTPGQNWLVIKGDSNAYLPTKGTGWGQQVLNSDELIDTNLQDFIVEFLTIDKDTAQYHDIRMAKGQGGEPLPPPDTVSFQIEVTFSTTTSFTWPAISGYTYNMHIDWGDGDTARVTAWDDADKTHEFLAGTYIISASETYGAFQTAGAATSSPYITDIIYWGDNVWQAFDLRGTTGLTYISATDIPQFGSMTSFANMFRNSGIQAVNMTGWNFSSATSISRMFDNADNIDTVSFQGAELSSVTTANRLCNQADSILYVYLDNTGLQPNDASYMFSQAPRINKVVGNDSLVGSNCTTITFMFYQTGLSGTGFTTLNPQAWNVSGVTTAEFFANSVNISTTNYDSTLINWDALTLQSGVTIDFGTSQYSAGAATTARTSLINNDLWSISDGGQVP